MEQIRLLVLERIHSGELAPGSPTPSTRHLAAEVGCNQGTVLRAYTRLTAQGYLVRDRRGFKVLDDGRADPQFA